MNPNDFNNQQPVQPVEPVQPVQPVQPVEQVAPAAPIAQTVVPTVQPVETVQKKKKSVLPIVLILLVVILAGGGVGAYFLFFNKVSAKQVVDGTINTLFSKATIAEEVVDKVFTFNYKNDVIKTDAALKVDFEGTVQGEKLEFKNIILDLNTVLNLKAKEASLKVGTSEKDKEIVNLSAFVKDDKAYLNSNVFENPYYYNLEDATFWDELNEKFDKVPEYSSNDLKTIVNKTKTYLKHTIKDEYLTQSEGNFTIDGTSVEGLKNSITVTDSNLKEMEINFYNEVLADEEFINILAKYEMVEANEIKDKIYDLIDEAKNTKQTIIAEEDNKYVVNIYTSKQGKYLGLEVTVNGTVVVTGVSKDKVTTYKIYNNDGTVAYTFIYDEVNKEYSLDYIGYNFKFKFEKDSVTVKVTGNDLDVTLKVGMEVDNESVDYGLTFNGSYNQGTNSYKGSVVFNTSISKTDKIESFDVTNAKNIEEVTPEEETVIETKFNTAIQGSYIQTITDIVNAIMTSYYSYPQYDYNTTSLNDLDYYGV